MRGALCFSKNWRLSAWSWPLSAADASGAWKPCFWIWKGSGTSDRAIREEALRNPNYDEVCRGTTGHAEVVQVEFDPSVTSFREIIEVFFTVHDPTTLNRQGADVGTQYRSAVFFHSPDQEETATELIRELEAEGTWPAPIITEVVPLEMFYPAEDYHADYFRKNPNQGYCRAVIHPKVAKFRTRFAHKLKSNQVPSED